MALAFIKTLLGRWRQRARKQHNRLERGRRQQAILAGYEARIREATWRKLAEICRDWGLKALTADDLLADVARRGEAAVVDELDRRHPALEFRRTWGQTRAHISRALYLELTGKVPPADQPD